MRKKAAQRPAVSPSQRKALPPPARRGPRNPNPIPTKARPNRHRHLTGPQTGHRRHRPGAGRIAHPAQPGLISPQRPIVGGWVSLIEKTFGWGMYLLPLALITVGVWLVVRNFERVPSVSVERLIGVALLFVNLLCWLHFFIFPNSSQVCPRPGGCRTGRRLYWRSLLDRPAVHPGHGRRSHRSARLGSDRPCYGAQRLCGRSVSLGARFDNAASG